MIKGRNVKLWRVDKVAEWRLCMGCGACRWACPNNAISLHDIIEKGIRPRINEDECHQCGKCVDVCPGIRLENSTHPIGEIKDLSEDWGPVLQIREGYAHDFNVRYKASSGGAATAIALWALEQGDYCGVLHIKEDPEDPVRSIPVFSRKRDDLIAAQGSRYSPASPCSAFDFIRSAEGKCVFIGKPCDCAALRKAGDLDSTLKEKAALIISIFCAGTPTTAGTLAILEEMGIQDKTRLRSFRYRGFGWPGSAMAIVRNNDTIKNVDDNELTFSMSYEQAWGKILTKYGQLRCRLCPDKTGEFADIAVGDPWYRERGNDVGRSLILIRSTTGLTCVQQTCESGYMKTEKSMWQRLPESQKSIHTGRRSLYGRMMVFKMLGIPAPHYVGFFLNRSWRHVNLLNKVKTITGTFKRIITRNWFAKDKI
ncbi:Coenzyme F420 hydrogenase/dehydrogenase, beta subunit C-terminal domain [Marispirochaeta aestuarii]|uniref:Coenzyme F420 hydrogenase/dehydrogenase, beta subunit C-terminal domain n=1 Tax=Marispirochaeta aestuarii TaxID=1963862 RepID=UPI002ABE075A|nr:Coenzyme F420 hydrogenase/dehydrogenase, beta subunit C-terminal domain [Marispirochaeta aestuarii]